MKKFRDIIRTIGRLIVRYPAEFFGIVALLFFLASFLHFDYESNYNREVRRVERRLHKRQLLMEKYALKALQAPVDEWISFDDLPEDMVLYKYNADTLQSWTHQFPISNDEVDVYPFSYRLQYLSNRNLYSTPLAYIGLKERYVNLGSAWYVVTTQISRNRMTKIVTGILIKNEYPNSSSLDNTVNRKLHLSKGFTTTSINNDASGVVYGIEGEPLFSVISESQSSFKFGGYLPRWLAFVFVLISLFIYHTRKRSWVSFAITIAGLVMIRAATFVMSAKIGDSSALFSPIIYADTGAFNSLGNFLFNNVFIALVVHTLFLMRGTIVRVKYKTRSWIRYGVVMILTVGCVALISYIHSTILSLINNSNIMMEPFRIEEMSIYSLLCYITFAMLFLALLQLLQLIIICVRKSKAFSMLIWKNVIVYIGLISLYCVIVVGSAGLDKEYESGRVWTDKLAVERDLNLELLLRNIEGAISNDPFVALLSSVDGRDLIKSRLLERYFSKSIDQKYNIELTICSPNDYLALERGATPVGCYAFYQDQLSWYGNPLAPNSHFFFMRNHSGLPSYLGIFSYIDNNTQQVFRLFIEITRKYSKEVIGYPEALLDIQNYDGVAIPKQYSYAKYSNGRLVSYGGDYNYPASVGEEDEQGYYIRNKGGFTHFINRVSDDQMTVVSRERLPFFAYLVSFSYLAIFFGLFIIIFTRWGRRSKLFSLPKYSLKRRITILTTLSMVIALISLGIGTIVYSLGITKENNRARMEEKIVSIQTSMSEYCKYAMRYNELNTPELLDAMERVASNTQSDINLYDTHGGLIRTTRPEIFEQYYVGKRINNKAYHAIAHEKSIRFVDVERIMDVSFYSIYAPLFNLDGNMVAIINIPYFSQDNDVNDANASIIATITNIYLLLLIAAIILGVTLSNSVSRPLAEIKKRMEGFAMNNKNEHIYYHNERDELGVLVKAYNKMVDDLDESTKQLAKRERDQAWSEMARQIAHEIKNPLTPMRLTIQYIMRLKKQNVPGWEAKMDELSNSLLEQIDTLSETANEFSSFAKFYTEDKVEIDLNEVLREVFVLYDNRENIHIEFVSELSRAVVLTRKQQMTRVFVNLITNAIQAIENSKGEGSVGLSLSEEIEGGDSFYKISVEDDGPGVDPSNVEKLFSPNFTTKSGGSGLGLAICRSIVEQSHGTISYTKSETLGGACFSVRLPRA